jgi:hypothetical protein
MKWIQWAIDNAWTLIIVGTVLAQLLQAVFKKKGGDGVPEAEQPKEFEFEDPELAERTRKIREEIQRKIEQRARGYTEAPSPVTEPEVEAPPPIIREVVVQRPVASSTTATRAETQRHAEILEQQVVWEQKLREAQRMKAAIQKRTAFESATADHTAETLSSTRGSVGDLQNPEALRRAFILREVLGPPVALRQ